MRRRQAIIGFCLLLVLVFMWGTAAEAIYLNKEKTFSVTGRVETKLTVTTRGYTGWYTVPSMVPDQPNSPNLASFNLKQHRTLAYIEGNYNFKPGSGYDIRVHATGRFLYEGVYEYGPDSAQAVRDFNSKYRDEIDDFSRDADLWEGYVDISKGPFFLRLGRQKISWGETDVYPMLDRIMPIDNTYGGIFEDLDDRRIPIWALRTTYNFGKVGMFNNLGAELFWEPAMIDQKFSPQAPFGSIYNFPQPSAPPYQIGPHPDSSIEESRWGVRLEGVLGNNFNWSLAYMLTYLTDPALKSVVDLDLVFAGDLHGLQMQKYWEQVHIVGGSFSFFEQFTSTIIRGELGYFIDEPAFQISKNFAALGTFLYVSDPASGIPPDQWGSLIPKSSIPEWNVLRFSIAVDRPFWVRFLNDKAMFSTTVEIFNEYYPSHTDDSVLPAPVYPSAKFVELHEWEQTIVALVTTNYMQGTLTPTVVAGFNPREGGAGFYTVSLEKRFGNHWKLKGEYNDVWGNKEIPPGVLFDWDQVAVRATYMF